MAERRQVETLKCIGMSEDVGMRQVMRCKGSSPYSTYNIELSSLRPTESYITIQLGMYFVFGRGGTERVLPDM